MRKVVVLLMFLFLILPKGVYAATTPVDPSTSKVVLRGSLFVLASLPTELKDQIVKTINQITTRENNRHNHWEDMVTKLEAIRDKIENKTERFKRQGKDVSVLENLNLVARRKLRQFRNGEQAQFAKQYTLNITNVSGVANNLLNLTTRERSDLQLVQQLLGDAKDAYAASLTEALKVKASAAVVPVAPPSPTPGTP